MTEPETANDSAQVRATFMPTSRLVAYLCLVFSGFRIPRYLPKLMQHMCIMLDEHANTSQDTYTLHQAIPNGQYPENLKFKLIIFPVSFALKKIFAANSRIIIFLSNLGFFVFNPIVLFLKD